MAGGVVCKEDGLLLRVALIPQAKTQLLEESHEDFSIHLLSYDLDVDQAFLAHREDATPRFTATLCHKELIHALSRPGVWPR
jgi:hypothetical protein